MDDKSDHFKIKSVPMDKVAIEDNFWFPKIEINKNVTLKSVIKFCIETGRISNFDKASGRIKGEFEGRFYNDANVYKLLEGIAHTLLLNPDKELESIADEIIDKIEAAQQPDGYIMTYFQLVEPDKKWTDMGKHEMFCAGQLIEAAVAYKHATGKDKLFNVACKVVEHIESIFGPDKRHWVTGHPEIELALIKLYRETKNTRYLNLSKWLIEQRGHGYRVSDSTDEEVYNTVYNQDDKPFSNLEDASGHAVRAMYLYSAAADIVYEAGDMNYSKALCKLWDSVVNRNMYITGGIGSSKINEGFTKDYDLPNKTSYCETCASVGMVYWNHRMNLIYGEGKYADIAERAMYNGAISGVSLGGDKFFYDNPLESDGDKHRSHWFTTSCCPTQIARFIPSIGDYIYMLSDDGIWINMFVQSISHLDYNGDKLIISQKTNYPYNGRVDITVNMDKQASYKLRIRFPGWCKSFDLYINNIKIQDYLLDNGYLTIHRAWKRGDCVTVDFHMPVELIHGSEHVADDIGKAAIMRGPLVYCIEQVDNMENFDSIAIPDNIRFSAIESGDFSQPAYCIYGFSGEKLLLKAVPYFLWDNRQPGKMKVWIDEEKGR